MKDKKMVIILNALTASEHKRFKAFVESPFFNTNEHLVKLLSFIQKYRDDVNNTKFVEKNAFKYLFPDQTFRADTISKLLNKLFDLLRKFIVQQDLEESTNPEKNAISRLKEEMYLADFYTKRLPKYAPATFEKAAYFKNELKQHDANYYLQDFKLASTYSAYLSSLHDKEDSGLNETITKLEIYYYLNQLYLTCLYVNQCRIASLPINLDAVDKLLNNSSICEKYLQIPAIAIWYECLGLLTQTDKKNHYLRIKDYLKQYNTLFGQEDMRIIYTFLENNAKKISNNDHEFYSELFELYDTQLQQGLIQTFQPILFKNIIIVALRLERFEWIKLFMASSQNNIILQYRDTVYQYIDVHLLFKAKKFEDALTALSQANFGIDLFFKFDARRMYLKIFYELKYESAFYDLVNSFRKFLTDQKEAIAEYHLQANRNFISIITRLYQLAPNDYALKQKIKLDISELTAQQLPEKNWLLQKIN